MREACLSSQLYTAQLILGAPAIHLASDMRSLRRLLAGDVQAHGAIGECRWEPADGSGVQKCGQQCWHRFVYVWHR